MIEGAWLYKYSGPCDFLVCGAGSYGSSWTWTAVKYVPPTISGYTYTWTINVSDLDAEGTTQHVVFEGEGYAPSTWSPSPWLSVTQH